MQQCPDCGRIYDESDYAKCPFCHYEDPRPVYHIVYDRELGKALELTGKDYEEFVRTHPEYQ